VTDGEPLRNIRLYSTSTFPVSGLSPPSDVIAEEDANRDLKDYLYDLEHPSPPNGSNLSHTSCRVFEMPPGDEGPMHRTISFDYGVVLDGSIEWELDSGEKRVLRKGDVSIQRGTAHAWKNVTPIEENNGWARIFFVILSSERITIKGGRELGHGFGLPRLADSAKSPR
jgi:mannose-6-phosphate isomerase-like protein (cupin superfamily)